MDLDVLSPVGSEAEGVVVIDEQRQLVTANAFARSLLDAGDVLIDDGGVLRLQDRRADFAFVDRIRAIATDADQHGSGCILDVPRSPSGTYRLLLDRLMPARGKDADNLFVVLIRTTRPVTKGARGNGNRPRSRPEKTVAGSIP